MNDTLDLSNVTVEGLRKNGYKVFVSHARDVLGVVYDTNKVVRLTLRQINALKTLGFRNDVDYHILPQGGNTVVYVTTPDAKEYCGVTFCSKNDSFCYKMGVKQALARLTLVKWAHKDS